MPFWISQVCERLTTSWLTATPFDYFRISSLVVVFGWILSKAPR